MKGPVDAARAGAAALIGLAALASSGADAHRVPDARRGPAVVEMVGIEFQPDSLVIAAGRTVEWRNASKLVHTVTADPAKAADPGHVRLPEGAATFDSGDVRPGETWRRTFEVPGTYRYFCVPHEAAGMTGTIVVTPGVPDARDEGAPEDEGAPGPPRAAG